MTLANAFERELAHVYALLQIAHPFLAQIFFLVALFIDSIHEVLPGSRARILSGSLCGRKDAHVSPRGSEERERDHLYWYTKLV